MLVPRPPSYGMCVVGNGSGGYALWPFGYSVGLLLPSLHLPHHMVDSPRYYLLISQPLLGTSGPVGRVLGAAVGLGDEPRVS